VDDAQPAAYDDRDDDCLFNAFPFSDRTLSGLSVVWFAHLEFFFAEYFSSGGQLGVGRWVNQQDLSAQIRLCRFCGASGISQSVTRANPFVPDYVRDRTTADLGIAFLPVPLVLTCFLALGVGLFVAAVAVFFADVSEIYRVGLTIVMYLTPIFYPPSIVPERFAFFLRLNPMYYFVELFRVPIYQGQLPDLFILVRASLIAISSLLIGWWFFTRKADAFAYRV
jgi:hypothetical protein